MTGKTNDSTAPLELIVLTPHGEAVDVHCDSVHLTICDDETGHGGGQVGFHRGHLPAVLALGDGPADALLHGEAVFHTVVHGGFASVRNDVIRVITDSAVDTAREATLTRQPNGTFTLELPVKQLSSMNMTGRLTGIAIGEVNYDGTLSGDLSDGTAVLTLKNLPASVLTGSDSSKALAVTCSIKMDTILLGDIATSAKMSIWVER